MQHLLVQHEFRSTAHLMSHHLLVQGHGWEQEMNVRNLLKINNKDTRLMPLASFWYAYC